MFAFLKQWELYLILAGAGLLAGTWLMDRHAQYEKGYAAAELAQRDAIVAYQKIVVTKEQERLVEMAQIASDHAAELQALKDQKPQAQEKIRVITKTIERPATCNLVPDELHVINEAVHSANGKR